MVCGVITIDDWTEHRPGVKEDFIATYRDASEHGHVHGVNLGVAAGTYQRAGGFQPHTFNEDVSLVNALIPGGATVLGAQRCVS